MSKFTPKQGRAIQAYIEKGYKLQMNNGPGYLNFENKDSGELERHTLDELVSWYDDDQKEIRRQKAAESKKIKEGKRKYV